MKMEKCVILRTIDFLASLLYIIYKKFPTLMYRSGLVVVQERLGCCNFAELTFDANCFGVGKKLQSESFGGNVLVDYK